MQLYYHKTDGGAEYLMDTFIEWEHNGDKGKEGTLNDETRYIVRIDGDITKDAELIVRETGKQDTEEEIICPDCGQKLVTRIFDVEGTHDLVEMNTCVECGYKSSVPVQ